MDRQRTIILSDRLDKVSKVLENTQGTVHWTMLTENASTRRIASFLRSCPDIVEIDSSAIFRSKRKAFQKNYIEAVAGLNRINSSLNWWALPPSTKDPKYTRLCWDAAAFLLITEVMQHSCETLIVLADSNNLRLQVKHWSNSQGIKLKGFIKRKNLARTFLKLYTPAPVVRALAVCLYRWVQAPRLQGNPAKHIVIVSQTYPESFQVLKNREYQDVYFGPLLEYIKGSDYQAMVVGIVRGPFRSQNAQLKQQDRELPILPFEGFLTITDIIWSAAKAIWITLMGIRISGSLYIEGKDVSRLMWLEFLSEYRSGNPFISFAFFRACSRLAGKVTMDRCIYPYENRPWEKMLLMAMRNKSPTTKLIGYQHAAINSGFLHFFMGDCEADITPLPDVLLTTGTFISDWLNRDGGYTKGIVQPACALRKKTEHKVVAKDFTNSTENKRILVALGFPDLENYSRVLTIIKDALGYNEGWDVVIRPHPTNPQSTIDAERAKNATGINVLAIRSGDLVNELSETDVVVYVASTVALEAASSGLPTICLDTGTALETDPMGDWDKFKWAVHDSSTFRDALNDISLLSQDQYQQLSQEACNFGHSYLTSVTESGIQMFLES